MKKVFISHSSKDEETCRVVVNALIQAGVKQEQIMCTAIPEVGIRGNDFTQEIVNSLEQSVFNVILFSSNYYNSVNCLNEAGIIWFLHMSKKSVPMLCLADKGFSFSEINGFVNGNTCQFFRLSEKEKRHSLGALCNNVRDVLRIKKQYNLIID